MDAVDVITEPFRGTTRKLALLAILSACVFALTGLWLTMQAAQASSSSARDAGGAWRPKQASWPSEDALAPGTAEQWNGRSQLPATPLGTTLFQTVYLPLVSRPPDVSLHGTVSENGVPVAGVTVTLFFCRAHDWNPIADVYCSDFQFQYTTTDAAGKYEFYALPTLIITGYDLMSQTYQVWWENHDDDPDRLRYWWTRELDSYQAGDVVDMGDLDIGGVSLIWPQAGSIVSLPVIFEWTRRAHVPSDSYSPCIVGGIASQGSAPLNNIRSGMDGPSIIGPLEPLPPPPPDRIGCDQPMGYVDSFVLTEFDGIDYEYPYRWMVQVYDQAGGSGLSGFVYFHFAAP
jgi:hypothetical protein